MKTTKAVVKYTLASPQSIVTVVVPLLVVIVFILVALCSTTRLDDVLLWLIIGTLATIGYLQSDWALGAVERLAPEVVWRIPTHERRAALTIDDVPLLDNPTSLEEILGVLRQNKVKATFMIMSGFLLEPAKGGMEPEKREKCLALLKQAVAEGHELGNHMQFDSPAITMSSKEFDDAFLHCDAFLAEMASGEASWRARPKRWFRPASALWNEHIRAMAREKGYTIAITNCYPHDVASVTRHINATYLNQRVRPGAVIVVHDRWHTPATLAKALPLIAANGIKLGTLSELHACANDETIAKKSK